MVARGTLRYILAAITYRLVDWWTISCVELARRVGHVNIWKQSPTMIYVFYYICELEHPRCPTVVKRRTTNRLVTIIRRKIFNNVYGREQWLTKVKLERRITLEMLPYSGKLLTCLSLRATLPVFTFQIEHREDLALYTFYSWPSLIESIAYVSVCL